MKKNKIYFSDNNNLFASICSEEEINIGDEAYIYDWHGEKWFEGEVVGVRNKYCVIDQNIPIKGDYLVGIETSGKQFIVGINKTKEIAYPPFWEEDYQRILSLFRENWEGAGVYYFSFIDESSGREEDDEQEIYGEIPENIVIDFLNYLFRLGSVPANTYGFDIKKID